MEVDLENHRLVRRSVNKVISYWHSHLRRRQKMLDNKRCEKCSDFRKVKKVVFKDKQLDVNPEQEPRIYY